MKKKSKETSARQTQEFYSGSVYPTPTSTPKLHLGPHYNPTDYSRVILQDHNSNLLFYPGSQRTQSIFSGSPAHNPNHKLILACPEVYNLH